MVDATAQRHLPLPKDWPARIRSSTVQAISLAYVSLTFTRGVAANSVKRMRLQAEVDCLRRKFALLREELRIKDARMLRIPARCRPHDPPAERLAILERRAARGWSTAETARRLLVSVTPARRGALDRETAIVPLRKRADGAWTARFDVRLEGSGSRSRGRHRGRFSRPIPRFLRGSAACYALPP